ncbi:hypothetical protein PR202_gb18858 [Eleusine coracana subsp. coracana]|uniref:Cell growth-regulating nucleolar protein-like winged helix domain-containing protein n=1 Tax=Eleusine coracana subsp. coracana TaxID=191504 RepID=A0AAV5F6I4_ELECO|nr:hypothetical protein PR202_gb18858 [Eleusine coracana subsp. coracana]
MHVRRGSSHQFLKTLLHFCDRMCTSFLSPAALTSQSTASRRCANPSAPMCTCTVASTVSRSATCSLDRDRLERLLDGPWHAAAVQDHEVESGNDSPDNTPKKEDKPAKDEVTKTGQHANDYEYNCQVDLKVEPACLDEPDPIISEAAGAFPKIFVCSVSQADDVNWWGLKYGFVSGGFLGATSRKNKRKDPANVRQIFAEEDQENLYNLVQDKATSGKQGLGIKGLPMKVAGQRWKGNKTSFGDSDEENSDQSGEYSEIEDDDEEEQSVNNAGSIDIAKNTEQELNVNVKPKTKVKKLCKRILRQVPSQSMKLKDLKVAVEEHSNSVFSSFSCRRDALLFLKQKV